MDTDFLVIGSGCAGLYCALHLPEDKTVTISNTGTISIDGNTNHANAIKLNGGKLFQNGLLTANSLNLDNMGGEVVATSSSSFIAEDDISEWQLGVDHEEWNLFLYSHNVYRTYIHRYSIRNTGYRGG